MYEVGMMPRFNERLTADVAVIQQQKSQQIISGIGPGYQAIRYPDGTKYIRKNGGSDIKKFILDKDTGTRQLSSDLQVKELEAVNKAFNALFKKRGIKHVR